MRLGFGGDSQGEGLWLNTLGRGIRKRERDGDGEGQSESLSDVGSWLGQQELGCASAWAGQLG